jgi:hypothetical protein
MDTRLKRENEYRSRTKTGTAKNMRKVKLREHNRHMYYREERSKVVSTLQIDSSELSEGIIQR